MKLTKKEKEVLGFYAVENFLLFIQIVIVFGMFCMTEDMMFLLVGLGLGSLVVLNEFRAKL